MCIDGLNHSNFDFTSWNKGKEDNDLYGNILKKLGEELV